MQLPKSYALEITKSKIDLSVSTNPLGCSPRVLKRLRRINLSDISKYPDPRLLKAAITKKFNISEDEIMFGGGSEQLIKLITQTFLEKGNFTAVQKGSFFLFTKETLLKKGRVIFWDIGNFPTRNFPITLLFLANPATPTGTALTNIQIQEIINKFNPKITVIDEANGEFWKESFINTNNFTQNVIVLRTFSKVLGLAGLRIAFACSNKILIDKLKEVQQPFPVSEIAILAATEALKDKQFITKTIAFISEERTLLNDELRRRGFKVSNSVTNNIFVETTNAGKIVTELKLRGVSVISGSFFPKNQLEGFRISIKDKKTNRQFLNKLDEVLTCIK